MYCNNIVCVSETNKYKIGLDNMQNVVQFLLAIFGESSFL